MNTFKMEKVNMKLDNKTVTVLKNFSTINPSILIKEGNSLTTISPSKTILAKAKVPSTFGKRFAIYNLTRFLGSVALLSDPDLTFSDKSVKISDENGKNINFMYADEATIMAPPEKELKLPSVDVTFKMTEEAFRDVIRATGVLGVPEVAVVGDGEKVMLQAIDSKNPSSDVYSIDVGATDKKFRVIFKSENIMKIMNGEYEVNISSKGISHFVGADVEYWIAIETSSTF